MRALPSRAMFVSKLLVPQLLDPGTAQALRPSEIATGKLDTRPATARGRSPPLRRWAYRLGATLYRCSNAIRPGDGGAAASTYI